jgi:hypothetical protein
LQPVLLDARGVYPPSPSRGYREAASLHDTFEVAISGYLMRTPFLSDARLDKAELVLLIASAAASELEDTRHVAGEAAIS